MPRDTIWITGNPAPFNLTRELFMALPTATKPPIFYRFNRTKQRWEYSSSSTALRLGNGMRSDVVHTKQPKLAEYEITNIRRQWSERNILFLTNPATGRSCITSPVKFSPLEEERPVVKTPAVRTVTYNYNEKKTPPRWQFTGRDFTTEDSYNLRDAQAVLTPNEVDALRAHWSHMNDKDFTYEVKIDYSGSRAGAGGYYRFEGGRWQYFIPAAGLNGAWQDSIDYKNAGAQYADRIIACGGRIMTINGAKYTPGGTGVQPTTPTSQLQYPDLSRRPSTLGNPALSAPYGANEIAAMQRSLERAVDHAALFGVPGQPITKTAPAVEVADVVLVNTERERKVRGIKRAIPREHEWLSAEGDLTDLSKISDEYLANIVNLMVRGARVNGVQINRTPERIRQGLNAAAEQAKRLLVKSAALGKAERQVERTKNVFKAIRELGEG